MDSQTPNMDSEPGIRDKVALVLGAIKGIGKGIGLALANEGVKLALTYFDWEESLDEMKNDFAKTGTEHIVVRANLLKTSKIQALIQNISDALIFSSTILNAEDGLLSTGLMLKNSGTLKWKPPFAQKDGFLMLPCRYLKNPETVL